MSGKYWISEVQLGLLHAGDCDGRIKSLLKKISDTQFLGLSNDSNFEARVMQKLVQIRSQVNQKEFLAAQRNVDNTLDFLKAIALVKKRKAKAKK